jgi:hypothetical protein
MSRRIRCPRQRRICTVGTIIAGTAPGGMGRAGTSVITVPGSEVTGGAVLRAGTGGAGAAVLIMGGAIGVGVDATPDVFTAALGTFITAD